MCVFFAAEERLGRHITDEEIERGDLRTLLQTCDFDRAHRVNSYLKLAYPLKFQQPPIIPIFHQITTFFCLFQKHVLTVDFTVRRLSFYLRGFLVRTSDVIRVRARVCFCSIQASTDSRTCSLPSSLSTYSFVNF